jgi:pimeloyl-ACP methyl ester carboxylesterase
MFWNVFLFTLGAYIFFCALIFLTQRKLLYFPNSVLLPEEQAAAAGLRYWPSYQDFRGFVVAVEPANPQGTVIVFHGNAGAAYHRDYYTRALSRLDYRVILAEYPGYGGRPGKPSEALLVEDALATIELADQEFGEPLFLWGESLGAGVVGGAVRDTQLPIQGLVLFTPWDTLPDLAQTHYPYLPARWLVLDQYHNLNNLQAYTGKIAVVLAGRDEVVPDKHGLNLYDSLAGEKGLWVFESATHNQMPISPELDWWQEVMTFLSD